MLTLVSAAGCIVAIDQDSTDTDLCLDPKCDSENATKFEIQVRESRTLWCEYIFEI